MLTIITQIICCIILAAIIGFVIGWILRSVVEKDETSKTLDTTALPKNERDVLNLREENQRLLAKLKACQEKSQSSVSVQPKEQPKDDLKKIKGIGPYLEKKLHDMGIYYFRQIANLSEKEIGEIESKLEHFQDRIRRDNWVNQAKKLYEEKYGKNL